MKTIITDNEAWVYIYNVETKVQSSQWICQHLARPKKARMSHSNMNSMLIVFFNCRGVVHQEFLP